MKRICLFIFLVATAGIIQAQKNMHKVFGTDEKIIKGASKADIFLITPTPMLSVDQVQGQSYMYDYPVVKTLVLNKKNMKGLVAAVLDTNEYLFGLNKKCPFMGKYAIRFRKGNKSVTLLISAEPCDKLIIFCTGSIIDKKHIDLRDKGKMVGLLKEMLENSSNIPQNKE